ncbi:OBP3-responsive protein 1 [Rhynchospora pubera]|uniref:OBP3-responsive protein 1 n=1 Tax=Rhynchospora pubera TaxID=906938 RepID=A0AAV8ER73_9POAL|nr:OBP3-responsive protein 1 [Rhynchospora pubera]
MALLGPIPSLRCLPSDGPRFRLFSRRSTPASLGVRCMAAPHGKVVEENKEEGGLGSVLKFSMADFAVANQVSVGLHGRTDELMFEATVCDPYHPLYNSRVVLRHLVSAQAKRRGRRALEVLQKLARRQLMYHSYAIQVHGYVTQTSNSEDDPFILVHGYHGSYSLRHWLQLSDWLPTLEATLALDEEWVRRVGDNTIGGPAVTRQLRLTRILMRDLLIGVNYLHTHGLAHTELRLENVHISPVDKHVKVGILGNAVDFDETKRKESTTMNMERRKGMIAFDMRCVGFIMAKLVLRELMDPSSFSDFKSFLYKGNDPSCLREFLLPVLCRKSPSGNIGLQMLDRNWGAGWNLLSLLLATKPSERISCLNALRHPFLCGPKWRVNPSMDLLRWGLGSTAVRMAEDYIYGHQQRRRIAHFIELIERLNPNSKLKNWIHLLPGRWRLLYSTGRHIGLTFRQPSPRVLIKDAYLSFSDMSNANKSILSMSVDITFTSISSAQWPHDKSGTSGSLHIASNTNLSPGRFYGNSSNSSYGNSLGSNWEVPPSLPVANLRVGEIDVSMTMESNPSIDEAQRILKEVRIQIPQEMFDLTRVICGTYIDSRMLVLRGADGSALLLTRSCV